MGSTARSQQPEAVRRPEIPRRTSWSAWTRFKDSAADEVREKEKLEGKKPRHRRRSYV